MPGMRGGSTFVSVRHLIEVWSMVGALPLPTSVNDIPFVTLLQSIGKLNSREICTVVAFASPASAWMRASWPGVNLVSIGGGGTHSSIGMSALNPKGSIVIEDMHPNQGALLSLLTAEPDSARV